MRLLVIEDELPMRTALVETLKAEGYRVMSAADGIAGLEFACTETFDLVLLDVMMPGLDGFAVCKEMRKRGRDVPVLMLTAKGRVDDRVEGLDCGADDYLVKPFSISELLARMRVTLRHRGTVVLAPQFNQARGVFGGFRVGEQLLHFGGATQRVGHAVAKMGQH